MITVLYSTSYSQDSIRCFNTNQQKDILKKFVKLDECTELRQVDSLKIFDLRTLNESISKNLHKTELKANRRKKLAFFGIPASFLSGFLVGILRK